jgi:hypothetical protein
MQKTSATSVEEYLAALTPERRETISAVRKLVLSNLPRGYVEALRWGMLSYEVPLERYPKTYNREPLLYAALAAQKHHFSLYLMGIYAGEKGEEKLREEFLKAGKKLDMGKSCVRFRKLDDLPLEVIARTIAASPVDDFIALYERSRGGVRG